MLTLERILVPTDFGKPSERALEVGADLAKRFDAELILVHVWELPPFPLSGVELTPLDLLRQLERAARTKLDAVLEERRAELPNAKALLRQGSPWREVLAVIDEVRPDVVIVGTHGRRGIGRALLGSVAERIVRMSPCPVLTVHAKGDG